MRWLAACLALAALQAHAATLEVGPDKELKAPSDAARIARDDDRVLIAPGKYVDCAVWRANRLTIEGQGAPDRVVIAAKVCQDKALFVTVGAGITVRGLTLAHARASPGNGAGIRAEGAGLTVERVRFVDNENGILSSDDPTSTMTVRDSLFERNGVCHQACAHGIYAGHLGTLRVERSRFIGTREGHGVKSRADHTEVLGCDIEDGADGTSSYLIEAPNGGGLVVRGNRLQKGPRTGNAAAISIGAEGETRPPGEIAVEGNSFENDSGRTSIFLVNLTGTPATLRDNRLAGPVTPLQGRGDSE